MSSVDSSKLKTQGAIQVLEWLADSPLFIDSSLVGAFYNAVVRPESTVGKTTISTSRTRSTEKAASAKLGVTLGLPQILTSVLPGLDLKASVGATAGGKTTDEQAGGVTVELHPVDNPQRQLVHLALHYFVNLPSRVAIVPGDTNDWRSEAFLSSLPRALVFIDLPPETAIIPTAAEVNSGLVIPFYDRLVLAIVEPGKLFAPRYPESGQGKTEEELKDPRREYWEWFKTYFKPNPANRIVEELIGDRGPVAWIDYRVPIGDEGVAVHLHLSGRRAFDTGVFAYNFIKRGYKHGLRIVGTLKSEPDVNVLAVFEK